MAATKIATCCYCGTKAALVLRGKAKRELTCGNCGAPLRALKMLPKAGKAENSSHHTSSNKKSRKYSERQPEHWHDRPKKRRKSKSFGKRVMSGLWDVVEDVVDEIFD